MRKVKLVTIFIVIFLAGFLIANSIKYYLDMWRADRNVQAWMGALQAPYTNDTYGGATPEETFDLYLAALKKGDLELASKYFAVNKQQKELEKLKTTNTDDYIKKLDIIKNTWVKLEDKNFTWENKAAYKYVDNLEKTVTDSSLSIDIKFEPGRYTKTVQFEKNDNNIWKLYLL